MQEQLKCIIHCFLLLDSLIYFTLGEKKIACYGEPLNVTCPENHVLVIENANFGRLNSSICRTEADNIADCRQPQTISILNQRCFSLKECEIKAEESIFGDACPGVEKYLEAEYTCVPVEDIIEACKPKYHQVFEGSRIGYVKSPKYPNQYKNGKDCLITAIPSDGNRYDVTIIDLDLEAREGRGCYDKVIVRDLENAAKTFDYCGDIGYIHTNEPIHVKQIQKLQVDFHSDAMNPHGGFLLKFKEVPSFKPLHEEF